MGGQLLKFLQNWAPQNASPGLAPASGVAVIWIWRGIPLSPPPFHPARIHKMEILQEQFDTLLKKIGLKACFLSLRPRFSSPGISRVLLTCSSSMNVDVQHHFEDTCFHIPAYLKSGRFLQVPFKWHIYQSRAYTFSVSLAPWLCITVARKLLLSSTLTTQHYANFGQLTRSDHVQRPLCSIQGLGLPPL